jgi:hypothetical protein
VKKESAMRDAVSATLTAALDAADPRALDGLGEALDTSAARRAALADAGVRVDESPYLHFLRRFAGETAQPALAVSA